MNIGDHVLNLQSSSKPKKSSTTNPETSDKKQTKETDKTADEIQVDDEKSPNKTETEQSTNDTEEHKTEE